MGWGQGWRGGNHLSVQEPRKCLIPADEEAGGQQSRPVARSEFLAGDGFQGSRRTWALCLSDDTVCWLCRLLQVTLLCAPARGRDLR